MSKRQGDALLWLVALNTYYTLAIYAPKPDFITGMIHMMAIIALALYGVYESKE